MNIKPSDVVLVKINFQNNINWACGATTATQSEGHYDILKNKIDKYKSFWGKILHYMKYNS